MVGNTSTSSGSLADKAQDYRDAAVSTAKTYGDQAASTAKDYKDSALATATNAGNSVAAKAQDAKEVASSIAEDLKGRASEHANDAKSVVSSMAEEARTRIADIVEQQKSMGADKLAGLSRAAQNAAGDLDQQNPHVARLVRDAASSVDRFAGDLRTSSLSDVVASVSSFARKQPVAFFAGSVLAGFVLARFLKSEPAPAQDNYYGQNHRG